MTSSSAIRRAAVAVPAADSRPCLPQLLCYALGIISHALCSCEKRQALWSARQSDRQLSAPCTPGVQQDWACCPPRPLFPSPAEAAASPKRSFCTKPGESPSEQGAGAGQRQPSSPRHTVNRRLPCAAGRPRAAGGGLGAAASAAALSGLPAAGEAAPIAAPPVSLAILGSHTLHRHASGLSFSPLTAHSLRCSLPPLAGTFTPPPTSPPRLASHHAQLGR